MNVYSPGIGWADIGDVSLRGFINPVFDHQNVVTWAFTASKEVERLVATEFYEGGLSGPIVAVNWEFFPAAQSLSRFFSTRLYFVPHSFEWQRSGDPHSLLSQAIASVESSAVGESVKTVMFDAALLPHYRGMGGRDEDALLIGTDKLADKAQLAGVLGPLLFGRSHDPVSANLPCRRGSPVGRRAHHRSEMREVSRDCMWQIRCDSRSSSLRSLGKTRSSYVMAMAKGK
ncbi:MAG: hypothetical protein RXR41_04775 [Candidatus Marsarchaeota archaeon]